MMLKRCFPPIINQNSRLLVLGSLPGEESLAQGRYYANPRNQFWRLIGAVIGRDLDALGYEQRLAVLLEAGVGLWDTVASASRTGSLDSAIRSHEANDLAAVVETMPKLKAVAFNGQKSAGIGRPALVGRELALITLPSSSPALTLPFDRKLEQWIELKAFL